MNAAKNDGILVNHIHIHIMADFGQVDGAWRQDDLAPCHAAKRSKATKAQLGLRCLPWIGQSADLNLI